MFHMGLKQFSTFIRALERVVGDEEIKNHLVMYVNDLVVHSSVF
jgi:hypothetical protein